MTRSRWLVLYTLVPTAVVRFSEFPRSHHPPSHSAFFLDGHAPLEHYV